MPNGHGYYPTGYDYDEKTKNNIKSTINAIKDLGSLDKMANDYKYRIRFYADLVIAVRNRMDVVRKEEKVLAKEYGERK